MPSDLLASPSALLAATVPTARSMLFACWAIVIVILAMALVFLRSGKKDYALAIVPLVITPFVHIFSGVLAGFISSFITSDPERMRVMIDVLAGLVSCLLLGLASLGLRDKKRVRLVFFWCCAGFVIILTLVLVTNTLAAIRA